MTIKKEEPAPKEGFLTKPIEKEPILTVPVEKERGPIEKEPIVVKREPIAIEREPIHHGSIEPEILLQEEEEKVAIIHEEAKHDEISFSDAIGTYKALPLSLPENIWKVSFFFKFCGCVGASSELPDDIAPIITHFLRFSNLNFSFSNEFHSELLNLSLIHI